uniref:UPF0114 protein BECKUNK1418G_GA0071005_100818 n=1 Tax=Candidatus Kentrum sp. UNK TaxID=2126344 RepID=A0A451AS56_9GAMM|nr:MAG: TIGR00645 family protein [Candidatus Kentron sp. UNK]VFK68817.1 MAG: TIGR00645 family protein [Candidatus Kentron sp. UNK]
MILKPSIENTLYASRRLLAPIYLGLGLILLALGIKFSQKIPHVFTMILVITEKDLVLIALGAIGFAMLGGLVISVVFSGYEIFISRLKFDSERKPSCLGRLDAISSRSKITVSIATSIVMTSSAHLLRLFMDVEHISNDKLVWYVVIHMTLVLSAVALGYSGRMVSHR